MKYYYNNMLCFIIVKYYNCKILQLIMLCGVKPGFKKKYEAQGCLSTKMAINKLYFI